jgi:hypothetical protein
MNFNYNYIAERLIENNPELSETEAMQVAEIVVDEIQFDEE